MAEGYDRNLKHVTLKGYVAALGPYAKIVDKYVVRKVMCDIHNTRAPAIWDLNMVRFYLAAMIVEDLATITKR